MMSLKAFIHKHKIKNEATSNTKSYQVLSSLSLKDVGVYFREGQFSSDLRILNFQPSKGTHWVAYINEYYFDSYGCVCPKKLSMFFIKQNG